MFRSGPCLPRIIRSDEWVVFNVNMMWFGSLWQVYCCYKYLVSRQAWRLSPADQRSSLDQEHPYPADLGRCYNPKCKYGITGICLPPQHHPTLKFLIWGFRPVKPSLISRLSHWAIFWNAFITRLVLMRKVGLSSDSTPYRQPSDLPNSVWVRCPHHLLLVVCVDSCQSPAMQGVLLCSHLWATWDGVGPHLFRCPAVCSHGWYMVGTAFRIEVERWVLTGSFIS